MYENFVKVYAAFQNSQIEDPLKETLKFFDVFLKRRLARFDLSMSDRCAIDASELVEKRKLGVPLEYILGRAPFMGQLFHCSKDALIPREETELLAKVALEHIQKKQEADGELIVIDMGTGCGNIAVSIALNTERTLVLASDLNPETVLTARKNVEKFDLQDRVSLFNGDLFAPLNDLGYESRVDMVVCNPPYIPTTSLKKMDSEIIDHEPREAFDAGPFGIDFFRRLINDSLVFLKPNGILVFEIGAGQEKLINRLFKKKVGFGHIAYYDDGAQVRVISAVRD